MAWPPFAIVSAGPLELSCTGRPAAGPSAAATCSTIGCAKPAPGAVTCSMPDSTLMPVSVTEPCSRNTVCTERLAIFSCTCDCPTDPKIAVAETRPWASEVDAAPASDTDCGVSACQTTGTLGIGLPELSSTRAVSGMGKVPGGPDWLLPLMMRKFAGWGGKMVKLKTIEMFVLAT